MGAGQAQTGRPAVPTPSWALPAEVAAVGLLLLTGAWYLRRRRQEGDGGERSADDPVVTATGGRPARSVTPPAADGATPLVVETEFAQAGRRAEARRAFNEAVQLEQQRDRAGAKAAYRRADEAGHAGAACNLGVLLELDGLLAEARAAYARADERGDANGAFNLACLLDEHGDAAGALAAYQRADRRGHPRRRPTWGSFSSPGDWWRRHGRPISAPKDEATPTEPPTSVRCWTNSASMVPRQRHIGGRRR